MSNPVDRGINNLVFSPPLLGCVLFLPGLPGGAANLFDRSPYGTPGTITGATWGMSPGGLGILQFDGTDDWVNLGTRPILQPSRFSVIAWIKGQTSGSYRPIIGWLNYDYPGIYPRFLGGSCIYMGTSNYRQFNLSPVNLLDGDWHLMVATVPGNAQTDINNAQMFADNGVQQTVSATYAAGAQAAKDRCYVGRAGTKYCNGSIAALRLTTEVLTAFEVSNIFQKEKALFGRV